MRSSIVVPLSSSVTPIQPIQSENGVYVPGIWGKRQSQNTALTAPVLSSIEYFNQIQSNIAALKAGHIMLIFSNFITLCASIGFHIIPNDPVGKVFLANAFVTFLTNFSLWSVVSFMTCPRINSALSQLVFCGHNGSCLLTFIAILQPLCHT